MNSLSGDLTPPSEAPQPSLPGLAKSELQLLLALSTECVRSQELHTVAEALVESVRSFFLADTVVLGLVEPAAGSKGSFGGARDVVRVQAATSPDVCAENSGEISLEPYHRQIWRQGAHFLHLEGEQIEEAFPGRFPPARWNRYYCIPLGIREPLRRGLGQAEVATLGPRTYVLDGVLEVLYDSAGLPEGKLEFLQIVGHVIEIAVSNWKLYRRLEQEKNFIEIVLEGMADGVLTLEDSGQVSTCNEMAARLLGRTRDQLVSCSLDEMLPLSRGSWVQPVGEAERWAHLISTGPVIKDFSLTLPLPNLGMAMRTFALQVSRRHTQGRASGPAAVVVFRDVSKQRELEQMRSDFTATLSHELRTPLTGMKGYLQMLMHRKAREFDYEKIQGIVAIINHQADQLHRLILELLDAAKLKSQALEIYPQTTDLVPLLNAACQDGKSASLSLALPDACMVMCDSEKIQSVLTHLISNALKYSVPGGKVEVECKLDLHFATISIRDEGVGIPLDQQDKIFEMYHRVETGNTRTHYGVGLGLYIARKVVEAHGGGISVVSTPGCGATFTFTLPLVNRAIAGEKT